MYPLSKRKAAQELARKAAIRAAKERRDRAEKTEPIQERLPYINASAKHLKP